MAYFPLKKEISNAHILKLSKITNICNTLFKPVFKTYAERGPSITEGVLILLISLQPTHVHYSLLNCPLATFRETFKESYVGIQNQLPDFMPL